MLTIRSFTLNPIQENTYLVYNEKGQACIIDPGCYFPEEKEMLKSVIGELGLTPVLLLNTHCHLDHVFGNKFVAETWGLELHLHANEKVVLDYAPVSGQKWQLPFDNYAGPLHFVEEGQQIKIGEDVLEVLYTPGHSPGSVSYYHKSGNWVISGDVLFRGSVGRTDLPGGNFDVLAGSIKTKLYVLPDETEVYSGHGIKTTIGLEKKSNPFVKAEG
jgi:glyoxylase-like metal-dependent hydrolase (beta-lactamase superfamily II)